MVNTSDKRYHATHAADFAALNLSLKDSIGLGRAFSLMLVQGVRILCLVFGLHALLVTQHHLLYAGMENLAAVDVFAMERGVFVVHAFAFDVEDVEHQAWAEQDSKAHYIVYHAARRLLLGLPNVLVLSKEDVADPRAFLRTQLQTLPMCIQV